MIEKRKIFIPIITLFLLIIGTKSMAEDIIIRYDNSGQGGETFGNIGYGNYMYPSNGTGTYYEVKDGNGNVIARVPMEDGTTVPNGGGMQGYTSYNGIYGKNQMQDGEVRIDDYNIAAVLRAAGNVAAAEYIENGGSYQMIAQQMVKITNPQTGNREWWTLEYCESVIAAQKAANNGFSQLEYDQWDVIQNMRKTWSDSDDRKGSALYEKMVASITGTPTLTTTPVPTPNLTLTPVKAPSRTPTPTKTPTPTPSPTPKPTPPIPSIEYVLEKNGEKEDCTSGTLKTTLKIDNEIFGVAAGNPIPTSEDLTVSGTTNWLARLSGIENWQLRITSAKNVMFRVQYTYEVTRHEYSVGWGINDSGEVVCTKYELVSEKDIDPCKYNNNKGDYKTIYADEWDTKEVLYSTKKDWTEWVDISDRLKGKTVGYTVTAGANTNGTSKVGVGNMVFLNGMMEADVTPASGLEIVRQSNGFPVNCNGYGDAAERVSKAATPPIQASKCCKKHAYELLASYSPGAGYFFNVKSDEAVKVTYNGREKSTLCNKSFYTEEFGTGTLISFTAGVETIGYWKENKSAGTKYDTTWAYHETADVRHWIEDDYGVYGQVKNGNVNDVRVHTPIHNELRLETPSPNQLENSTVVPGGVGADPAVAEDQTYQIVTMGDKFTAVMDVTGHTYYYDYLNGRKIRSDYDPWPTYMKRYIKMAEFHCDLCGKTIDVTDYVKVYGKYKHECRAYINKVDDLQTYNITSKVVAENEGWISGVVYGSETDKITNTPDSSYTLIQTKGIFVVGKIYDLEIRTVNDPDWKLKVAEKLSKLPTGEKGDNGNKAIKDGIKLGYRAYFDLKTLGSASKEIEIIPKIYYINKTTGKVEGVIGEDLEMWIKTGTGKTDWDKLDPKDIIVKMQMNNTNGSVNNPLFKYEQVMLIKNLIYTKEETIDYTKNLTIGGLLGINLGKNNSVATKCTIIYREGTGAEKTKIDYTSPETKSRRWLGEIYIPATAKIIKADDYNKNKSKIMNDKETYKDGYLLLTFEVIRSKMTDPNDAEKLVNYLRYDEIRDSMWRKPEDAGFSASSNKSVLVIEKAGKGETTANPILLPNGKKVADLPSDFYKTTAPMIIYDLSLRANNDIEDLATH